MSTPTNLAEEVAQRSWYHSIELAPGIVTPGWFDTRPIARSLPFPELSGKRCLDVGTFDGFWAFEMERRGAREVVALDVIDPEQWDWPVLSDAAVHAALAERKGSGDGFLIASQALGSKASRLECNVYDLDQTVHGTFDFIYVGSILLHLRDPVRALERIRSVCAGQILVVDAIDLPLTLRSPRRAAASLDGRGRPWWWKPNVAGLTRMVEAAGFTALSRPQLIHMPPGPAQGRPPLRVGALRHPAGRSALYISRRGDPHGVVGAVPR